MDPNRARRILRQHVETDRLLGVDQVPVGVPPQVDLDAAAAPASTAPLAGSPRFSVRALPGSSFAAPVARPAAPPGSPLFPPAGPASYPGRARLDRQTRIQVLDAMDQGEVRSCTRCELCRGRTHTVFGEGDPEARVMFVGEGPGENEDLQGRPFVGKAGELLNKQIAAMGFTREQVYIANIVKCRPPGNRAPELAETAACWDYLRRQVATILPAAIVTLGSPSTKTLLQTNEGITKIRGIWHQFTGLQPEGPAIPVMPTFHPAYLLRNYTQDARGKVWSDLKKVMALLKQKVDRVTG